MFFYVCHKYYPTHAACALKMSRSNVMISIHSHSAVFYKFLVLFDTGRVSCRHLFWGKLPPKPRKFVWQWFECSTDGN